MNGYYFTPTDRRRIARMWAAYIPAELIAFDLKVNPATVHRELKRGNADGELDENKRLKYDP
ncbi:MAG: helix-turn-helix domain-containing protein, partial [Oscillospiraceae bacterium]|nr:helix-turn-helix domain-containing protein [Oscillospiraceae bacterium]